MTLFACYGIDKAEGGDAIRATTRPAHGAWLKSLGDKLKMAGPLFADDGTTMIGSLVMFEGDSVEEIRELIKQDPYHTAGLFVEMKIHPYKWVLGDGRRPQ